MYAAWLLVFGYEWVSVGTNLFEMWLRSIGFGADGPVRRDVGLLGSPAFEIPGSVQRDAQFDELKMEEAMNRLLPSKNRDNIVSMVLYLAVRWFLLFVAALAGAVAVTAHDLWRYECMWKLLGGAAFNGTPFKPVFWRVFGVRMGKAGLRRRLKHAGEDPRHDRR